MTQRHYSGPAQSRYDDRLGLGYGQISNNFHKPRVAQSTFPYLEPDDYADDEFEDEDSERAIASKILKYNKSDFAAHKSSDPFYFVAGNTKLSDCFFRTDEVLYEIESLGSSMSSAPGLYAGPKVSEGAASYITTGNYKRTGSKRGWSSSPPEIDTDEDEHEPEFYSLSDLASYLGLSSHHRD